MCLTSKISFIMKLHSNHIICEIWNIYMFITCNDIDIYAYVTSKWTLVAYTTIVKSNHQFDMTYMIMLM
jgi:hypothetical protein